MKQSLGFITGMFVILVLASMAASNSPSEGLAAITLSTTSISVLTTAIYDPHPVGGVVVSTDKLAILAPYLVLAGLAIAVSAVLVVKKRKA